MSCDICRPVLLKVSVEGKTVRGLGHLLREVHMLSIHLEGVLSLCRLRFTSVKHTLACLLDAKNGNVMIRYVK